MALSTQRRAFRSYELVLEPSYTIYGTIATSWAALNPDRCSLTLLPPVAYEASVVVMSQLSETFRGDLRAFAFYIGNGTLNYLASGAPEVDYSAHLNRPNVLLQTLVAIYLNNYMAAATNQATSDPVARAADYLAASCLPDHPIHPPLEPWELTTQHAPDSIRGAILNFAGALGRGALAPAILGAVPYHAILVEYGSFLEQVFAIFSNIITIDDGGVVSDGDAAEQRAAQYIRNYCDPAYQITPPLAAWETELV